jgi:hypothetical protein
MSIVKQLDADALLAKRVKLDEMLLQCSSEQTALFWKIYNQRAAYLKKTLEQTLNLDINTALDIVERTINQNVKTGRYTPDKD